MSVLPWLLSADCPVASITSAAWHCRGQGTGCDLPVVIKLNGEQKTLVDWYSLFIELYMVQWEIVALDVV